jgi:hypothetical protein
MSAIPGHAEAMAIGVSGQLPMFTDDRITPCDLGKFLARELIHGVFTEHSAAEVLLPGHLHQVSRLLSCAPPGEIERLGLGIAPKVRNKRKRRAVLEASINRECNSFIAELMGWSVEP